MGEWSLGCRYPWRQSYERCFLCILLMYTHGPEESFAVPVSQCQQCTFTRGSLCSPQRTLKIMKGSRSNEQRAGELSVTVLESICLGLHVGIVKCRCHTQMYALCPSLPIPDALHTKRINIHYHLLLLLYTHLPFTFFSCHGIILIE